MSGILNGGAQKLSGAARPVRVGHIAFLNCFPLYYGLGERADRRVRGSRVVDATPAGEGVRKAEGRVAFELVPGVPTDLNRMLVAGTIDFGPISSIAYARSSRHLALSRRLSISSRGAVDSIQLVAKKPIRALERIALTPKSATSVVLLKSMLKLRYGLDVFYSELLTSPEEALETHDAVLLIGDDALEAVYFPWFQEGVECHDLARLWYEWIGLPMVYAVWATRVEFLEARADDLEAVEDELVHSVEYSRDSAALMVDAARGLYRFGSDCMTRYFNLLHYGFSPDYQEGLRRFFAVAEEAGELADVPELRFMDGGV